MKDRTSRGFGIAKFEDWNNQECSLQESSAIDEDNWESPGSSAIWLGRSDARMHLTRSQVKWLIAQLVEWL